MAPISTAREAQAPTGFGSWVSAKAACAALVIITVAVLTACGGGGGGAATPDTPSVTPSATTLTLVLAKVDLINGVNVVVYTAFGNKGADGANIDITAATTFASTFTGQALKAGATLSVASNGHLQENGIDLVVIPGVTVSVGGTATYDGKTISVTPTILTGGCEAGLVAIGGKCASKAFSEIVVYSTANSMVQIKFGHGPTADYFVFDGANGRPGKMRSCLISDKVGKKVGGVVLSCNTLAATSVFTQYEVTPGGYIQKLPADEALPASFDLSHDDTHWIPCPAFGEHWFFIPRTNACTNANLIRYADGTVESVDGFRSAIGF